MRKLVVAALLSFASVLAFAATVPAPCPSNGTPIVGYGWSSSHMGYASPGEACNGALQVSIAANTGYTYTSAEFESTTLVCKVHWSYSGGTGYDTLQIVQAETGMCNVPDAPPAGADGVLGSSLERLVFCAGVVLCFAVGFNGGKTA